MDMIMKGIRLKFSDVNHMSTSDLSDKLASHATVTVDARPENEHNVSHIEGAIRVADDAPDSDIKNFIENLPASDNLDIVCYCSVGYRSSVLARRLQKEIDIREMGDKLKVYNLEGSIFKWANENRPMVDGCERTTRFAHPYNTAFGMVLRSELRKYTLE